MDGMPADGGGADASSLPPPMMPDMLSASCPPVHFVVPMFGGSGPANATDGSSFSTYHYASDTAHQILGALLLCMVVSWGAFVMEGIRLRTASKLSGAFQLSMGLYLFSWLYLWMHPSDLPALWAYSTKDMLQLQHAAIAALLCAGGIIELLQGYCLLPPMVASHGNSGLPAAAVAAAARASGTMWTMLWSTTLVMVGLVFTLHPQHTYSATIKHLLLGVVLVLGSPLMVRGKSAAWKSEIAFESDSSSSRRAAPAHTVDWSMVAAGGAFALAACILVAFKEHATEGVHIGTTYHCQPSMLVVVGGYVLSLVSTALACVVAARQHQLNQRKRMASSGSTGAAAPAAQGWCSSLRSHWAARRFRKVWGGVDEEEQQGMVGMETLHLSTSASPEALRLHVASDEDSLARDSAPDRDERLEFSASESPLSTSNGNGVHHRDPSAHSSNGDLVSRYAHTALQPLKPRSPRDSAAAAASALHTISPAHEEEEEFGEERWREMQREARRQEGYTGEEDDA